MSQKGHPTVLQYEKMTYAQAYHRRVLLRQRLHTQRYNITIPPSEVERVKREIAWLDEVLNQQIPQVPR